MREKQSKIIWELGTVEEAEFDVEQEIEDRIDFLAQYLENSGTNGFVLGISGGQDSLLAGLLAQRAVKKLQQQGKNVKFHAVLLPYGEQADRTDAWLACKTISPGMIHDINIKSSVDAMVDSLGGLIKGVSGMVSDYEKGNIKARIRMAIQYALAGKHKLLVIGTDHAAEAVTGFFTKYGDGGADILPLSGLTKRQGRALLRHLGAPEIFTTKAPTADLLDAVPGQTDESELGITYDQLDDYLEGKDVDEAVAEAIEARYEATEHKRALPVAFTDFEYESQNKTQEDKSELRLTICPRAPLVL